MTENQQKLIKKLQEKITKEELRISRSERAISRARGDIKSIESGNIPSKFVKESIGKITEKVNTKPLKSEQKVVTKEEKPKEDSWSLW